MGTKERVLVRSESVVNGPPVFVDQMFARENKSTTFFEFHVLPQRLGIAVHGLRKWPQAVRCATLPLHECLHEAIHASCAIHMLLLQFVKYSVCCIRTIAQ